MLQWKPPTYMAKKVTAYKVEYAENQPSSLKKSVEVSVDEISFTVPDLLPGTEYRVSVTAVTPKNTGAPTEIIATTGNSVY